MSKETLLINMSDAAEKRELMMQIGRLSGLYEVYIKPRKRTRSLDQNAYYWAAVVQPFTEWLREEYGDSMITKEQAHELLKRTILGMSEKYVREDFKLEILLDSHTLDTKEFSAYIEGCAKFLDEFANIIVVPSELFFEGATLPKNPKSVRGDNQASEHQRGTNDRQERARALPEAR